MARSKVGKPTGQVTQHGRQIYKTPAGEEVSEKSVTIPMAGKWVNAPSIWNGKKLTEDGVERAIREGLIKPTSMHDTEEEAIKAAELRSKTVKKRKYNAGGLGGSPALDYEQQMMEMESQPPEDSGEEGAGKALTGLAADLTPGIGEVRSVMDAKKSFEEGDMFGAGLGVLGAVPGIGMGARLAKRALNTVDEIKALPKGLAGKVKEDGNAFDKLKIADDEAAKWKKENAVSQRQKQKPELKEAATKLQNKEITKKEYTELVDQIMPIKMIEEMPRMPSTKDIALALTEDKVAKGIVGVNKNIEDGTRVASRLDIPAYETYDTWVVSLHDGTKTGGNAIGYGQTAVLKNVDFKTAPKGALNIATEKSAKNTIARIYGDWVNKDPDDVYNFAKQALDSPEWTQVGMNPYRHSFFYDKATGEPVVSASEVVQVGPLVLAKDVKKTTIDDPMFKVDKNDPDSPTFAEGGIVEDGGSMKAKQQTRKLLEQGGMLDEGGTVDPASGNEVPTGSLQEEVRDDIPAQLSEGEFVFPADVVRFIGLERLMQMRQAAKRGLAQMDNMGQMGNADEATMDDGEDTEFETEIDDILAEVESEANQGTA